jgi:serine/threonine protein kinase
MWHTSALSMERYEQVGELPPAGLFQVILVREKVTQQLLVLKRANLSALDEGEKQLVFGAVEMLNRLNNECPNSVLFVECFTDGDFGCIVLEHCELGTLHMMVTQLKDMNEHTLPEPHVLLWIEQLALALQVFPPLSQASFPLA